MFKKRFLFGLATSSIVLVSLMISSFAMTASPLSRASRGSLGQRHAVMASHAQASNAYRLDCFRRYYNFSEKKSSALSQKDASNYFLNLS